MSEERKGLVLFIFVENTFRSVIAEAPFKHYARSGWRAESADVKPAAEIKPVNIERRVLKLIHELGHASETE